MSTRIFARASGPRNAQSGQRWRARLSNSVTMIGLLWLAVQRDALRKEWMAAMTEKLFLDHPGLRTMTATVLSSGPDGIVLDRTVFYARSGGQPGDIGVLSWAGGTTPIVDTVKGEGETMLHLPAPDASLPEVGVTVEGTIDWDRRYRLMRMHTAMHLLCSVIKGAAVTGGLGRRGSLAAGFRFAQSATEGGYRGWIERADRGRLPGADRMGG